MPTMRAFIFSLLFLCIAAISSQAADMDAATARILKSMLTAVEENDYDAFVASGDAAFTAALTKQQLDGVSKQMSPRMEKGYEMIFLGELQQHGSRVCIVKLKFNDHGDDCLVKLVLTDGKVGGFWIQ